MKIIAVDPGNQQSAFVVLDESKRILAHGIVPNADLLPLLKDGIVNNDLYLDADCQLAIEMIQSFGMAVGKEVFETVFWTGRFFQAWKGNACRVFRSEVKMHLCKSMRAKDGNIRQALLDKLGPQGTKKAKGPTYGISKDAWSALAVGVTWIETKQESAVAV